MKARILQILFGIAMFFCSTPFGMAKEAIAEEVRAVFFAAADLGDDGDWLGVYEFNDAGLVQFADCEGDGESSVDGEEEVRREVKRKISLLKFISYSRFTHSLSAKSLSKGVSKHPETQDAGQERTKAIRFLHLASLVC